MSVITCPTCSMRLSAFIRMRTNEHVVYCPQCSMTRHVEGIGASIENALVDLEHKMKKDLRQKELV